MNEKRTYADLPRHPVPDEMRGRDASLAVSGLTGEPVKLGIEEISRLEQVDLAAPFECEEGWSVPGLRWRGVRLADVVQLVDPRPTAAFVRVVSGSYAVPLALPHCQGALLAHTLNGEPLAVEHGGPWRLVVPEGACFTSVKWVERLELTEEAGPETGRDIARARLGKQG